MSKEVILDGKKIGNGNPCYIIAEIGSNHNGDIENAYKLIDVSKEAGADAVKFQSYKAETLYSKYVPRRKFDDGTEGPDIYEMISRIQMPYEWHKPLKEYCDKVGITFCSSPFDLEAVQSLEDIGCPFYKIASSELGDPILIKAVAKTGKPMVISTGKATMEDVDLAVSWCKEEGNEKLILLHCTATYPAKYESMNLNVITSMQDHFDFPIGLSDHNTENITAVSAITMGANLVEKHITLDRNMNGPDHNFALEPDGLNELCRYIRNTERAMGDPIKKVDASEKEGVRIANRSIHINRDMKAGDVIELNDIIIKRPSLGIAPRLYENILGKKLIKDIKADMWLTKDDLEEF